MCVTYFPVSERASSYRLRDQGEMVLRNGSGKETKRCFTTNRHVSTLFLMLYVPVFGSLEASRQKNKSRLQSSSDSIIYLLHCSWFLYILLSAMLREGPWKGVRKEPKRLTFDPSGRVISSSHASADSMEDY